MSRRELREHIFCELFANGFYPADSEESREQLELYFTHLGGDGVDYAPDEVSEADKEEVKAKTLAVCDKTEEIDRLLDETSVGWTTSRMSRVDLAILRLGAYELLYDETIPTGVAINEAVLLAKKFGGEDSSSFINGILGKIQRQREGQEE